MRIFRLPFCRIRRLPPAAVQHVIVCFFALFCAGGASRGLWRPDVGSVWQVWGHCGPPAAAGAASDLRTPDIAFFPLVFSLLRELLDVGGAEAGASGALDRRSAGSAVGWGQVRTVGGPPHPPEVRSGRRFLALVIPKAWGAAVVGCRRGRCLLHKEVRGVGPWAISPSIASSLPNPDSIA